MSTRILVISDTQIPFDDRRAVRALVRCIGDIQPDSVIHIGDLMDYPSPSRWTKGTSEEFARRIKPDSEQAKARLLGPIREVYDGPFDVHEGNHDERPHQYLSKFAPALAEFADDFRFENLLDFNGFGMTVLPEFNTIAPGWITTHGHKGGIRLSQDAGKTAQNAAKRMLSSVVMGHTHRQGILPHSYGFGGVIKKTYTGVEVGNLMSMKQAQYLKGATANWQQGFAMLTIDGANVTPSLVPIQGGRFTVDNHSWEL